jgi:hypothetical protein
MVKRKNLLDRRSLYALCIDRKGQQRKVTIWPAGKTFFLQNEFEICRRIAHGSRQSNQEGYRREIYTVYQYHVERFVYPWMDERLPT